MSCTTLNVQTILLGILFLGGGIFWSLMWHSAIDKKDRKEDEKYRHMPFSQWEHESLPTSWYAERISAMIIPVLCGVALFVIFKHIL